MKKVLILSSVLCFFAQFGFCDIDPLDPFGKFKDSLTGVSAETAKNRLNNFAKDLGPIMGGCSYHGGKVLGFPGFDLSIAAPFRPISNDNTIINNTSVENILFPLIQAEIGLPMKWDVIARWSVFGDASMTGFGLRYGIIKDSLPGIPDVSVQSVYNSLSQDHKENKFSASTLTTSAAASINLAMFEPYIGVSYDMTTVEPGSSTGVSEKGEYSSVRIDGGINFSPLPLIYISLGFNLAENLTGYNFGLGIKF